MRVAKLMAGIVLFLTPLLAYIRISAPETALRTYGWVISGYLWGAMTVVFYFLWATRNLHLGQHPKKLDDLANQVVEIDLPEKDTSLH